MDCNVHECPFFKWNILEKFGLTRNRCDPFQYEFLFSTVDFPYSLNFFQDYLANRKRLFNERGQMYKEKQ